MLRVPKRQQPCHWCLIPTGIWAKGNCVPRLRRKVGVALPIDAASRPQSVTLYTTQPTCTCLGEKPRPFTVRGKKVKVSQELATKAQRGSRCIAVLFLQPRCLLGVDGQHHSPTALPQGKTRYPLYRRLGGPQGRSGRGRKFSPPPGFDPRTVQPVASRYTVWAMRGAEIN